MLKIAHRGASGYEFENSMSAFQKAIELKVDMIETDVQQSRDGKFFIFHDHSFDRCTNSKGFICDFTSEEIIQNVRLNNGESIPTLKEFCSFLKNNNTIGLFELKNDHTAQTVCDIIKNILDLDKFIIGSFFHEQILQLKNDNPTIQTCIMLASFPINFSQYIREVKVDYVAAGLEIIAQAMVDVIKNAGAKTFVWTVNDLQDIEQMKKLEADGIISNYLDRM